LITGKQRAFLKSIANDIVPIFQVGKGGINDNMIKQFDDALEAREIVKATVLKNSLSDTRQICEELAGKLGAEIVQVIGNKFVLYRESKNHKVIELP